MYECCKYRKKSTEDKEKPLGGFIGHRAQKESTQDLIFSVTIRPGQESCCPAVHPDFLILPPSPWAPLFMLWVSD